ncbi:MAG: hypothetical protein FWC98_00465 [Bacteroidales bacterium]|nr:hypothetical protein [Bacteroidales bacterium]
MKKTILFTIFLSLVFAITAQQSVYRIWSDAAMFSAPNVSSELLQIVSVNASVRFIERQGDFNKIEYRHTIGFIGATIDLVDSVSCNRRSPGWGYSLGQISFASNRTNAISGNGVTQIWSDAVTATACQKTSFYGGFTDSDHFSADCRSNPNSPGDLFSWCAVVRFAEQLCPYPWQVPTMQDFIDLDIALGGTGDDRERNNIWEVIDNYLGHWGGAFGGMSVSWWTDSILGENSWGNYWSVPLSQPEMSTFRNPIGHALIFGRPGFVRPQGIGWKPQGFTLRCVR